jgi:hypothetical protein
MDTKRCLSCRKVLRADAHYCSRCGYVFSQALRRTGNATNGSGRSTTASFPSNPPASPHRAGHYSGFHPEDQPFQSSFMPVQRPPAITRRLVEIEPGEVLLPVVSASSSALQLAPAPELPVPEQLPKRRVASPAPLPIPMPQRHPGVLSSMPPPVPQLQFVAPPLPPESALHEQITAPLQEPVYLSDKRQSRNCIVPILLLASCLFFLLATSILAFLLLDKGPVASTHPVLTADPGVLRVGDSFLLTGSAFQANGPVNLTRDVDVPIKDGAGKPVDVHTDKRGNFAVQITITSNWDVGTHSISANDNMHPSVATTITVQPTPLTPPKLQLPTSPIDLGTNVPGAISHKTITLTNSGGGQIDWQAGSDSPSWLTISPTGGTFFGKRLVTLTVNRANLAPQAYTGYITFYQQGTYKALTLKVTMAISPFAATVTVSPPPATLTVSPPALPAMVVKSNSLAFSTIQGTNPAPQTFTITNTGNAPLNWAITEDANAAAFAPVSSTRGALVPGKSAVITVKPNVAASTTSPITGHITISDTDKGTPVQSQQVTVTITISNQAVISVSTTSLTFNSTSTIEAPAQLLTITNTGSAPLNWTLSQPLPSWLSVDIPGGPLPPKATAFVNVASNSTGLSPGTYTYTLVVSDTDANTPVTPQNIQVTLTVT